ncbi:MAG: PilN domain-containing protein [Syntrophomonadaceae bacterium]|jgi:Tfp pilus assembly protein PilN
MNNKEPRINLLRYMQEGKVEKKSDLRFILILGLAVLLFTGIMAGTWWMQGQKLQAIKNENQQLQKDIEQLTKAVSANKNTPEGLNSREAMLNALESRQKVKSKQLEEIYQLTIPGVTIAKIDVKSNNSFTMSAYCNSQAKCITFLEQLRELEYIKDVKVLSSKLNDKTGEVSFNFNLIWGVK